MQVTGFWEPEGMPGPGRLQRRLPRGGDAWQSMSGKMFRTRHPECGRKGRARGGSLGGTRLDRDLPVTTTSSKIRKRQSTFCPLITLEMDEWLWDLVCKTGITIGWPWLW